MRREKGRELGRTECAIVVENEERERERERERDWGRVVHMACVHVCNIGSTCKHAQCVQLCCILRGIPLTVRVFLSAVNNTYCVVHRSSHVVCQLIAAAAFLPIHIYRYTVVIFLRKH